jgi:hypothetical protein
MKRLTSLWALLIAVVAAADGPPRAALQAATRGGKYAALQQVIEVPEDLGTYGEVHDWGYWSGTAWAGHTVVPGYWVYVYPHWFIFAEKLKDTPPESPRPGATEPGPPEPRPPKKKPQPPQPAP